MLKKSFALAPARPQLYQAKLAFHLFLLSLGMFFAAMLVSYYLVRVQAFQPVRRQYLSLQLPAAFWYSTALLILVSVKMHTACWFVHRERRSEFRIWTGLALLAAVAFVLVQIMGLQHLVQVHFTQLDGSTKAYGLCFTLASVHGLHVLGGIAFLGLILVNGLRGRYDHERHWTVDNCAAYWHFLFVVWVAMLIIFLVAR